MRQSSGTEKPVKYDQRQLKRELIEERGAKCWIAHQTGRLAAGPIDACHVVPKAVLKKVFPYGAYWDPALGFWQPLERNEDPPEGSSTRTIDEILMDHDNVELGSRELHSEWDVEHARMIPYERLRPATIKFATEHGVLWWLREYYDGRAVA